MIGNLEWVMVDVVGLTQWLVPGVALLDLNNVYLCYLLHMKGKLSNGGDYLRKRNSSQ